MFLEEDDIIWNSHNFHIKSSVFNSKILETSKDKTTWLKFKRKIKNLNISTYDSDVKFSWPVL